MLKIKDMNSNNVIRQGDSQPREYQLDAGNLNLNLANKQATIRLMTGDYRGIAYETTATVSSENKISFSIDDIIPAREYRLEITVDDYVFPSRATDGRFDIDPSSHGQEVNIIQVIGKDEIVREVKEQIEPFLGEVEQAELDRQAQEEARETAEGERQEEYQKYGQQFTDVITELSEEKDYHSLPEIAGARGGFDTLGDRLNETTAQLAQTATSKIDKDGSGQVKWSNLAQDARENISGNKVAVVEDDSVITTNLTDNVIKTSKIGKNEVTAETTNFINTSTNLLNRDDVVYGKIVSADGTIVTSDNYHYSHKINVLPGQTLFTRNITMLAFFNQFGEFVSRSEMIDSFAVVPDKAYYVRGNILKSRYDRPVIHNLQVSISDVEIPYEPYYQKLSNVGVSASDVVGQFGSSHIKDFSVTDRKVSFLENSSNLLNRENIVEGKTISTEGTVNDSNNYNHSHIIDVLPNQTLFIRNITSLAYYDQVGGFIRRVEESGVDLSGYFTVVPDGAYYLRVNIQKIRYDAPHAYDLQVSISDVEIPYEPYYVSIRNLRASEPSLLNFKTDDRYVVNGKVDEVYQSEQLEGYEDAETDWLPEKIYQKFDELLANYPDYVSKTNLGKDSSGDYDVNYYRFKPKNVPTLDEQKRPKMILIAGNHGYEKTHPYVLYLVMKKLCEEWRSDESLETLRWNVDFIVMPCTNPSSFPSRSRTNVNGVDISRNFEDGWERGPIETKGSHPLSEPEAQYIDEVLKEHHEDAIFFTSLHNFSSSTEPSDTNKPEYFIWIPADDDLQAHISQEFVSRMSRFWKQKYSWIPQDDELYLGYVNQTVVPGAEKSQANLYGISASTYEISRIFQLEENPVINNSQVITMGVEGLVNLLLLNLKIGTEYYNQTKKVIKK